MSRFPNFNVLIQQVNEQIQKVENFINSNIEVFEPMNLKLYDASYQVDAEEFDITGNRLWELFNLFCEDEFNYFCDWEKENNISDNVREYIGRTSTFRLSSNGLIEFDSHRGTEYTLSQVIENVVCNNYTNDCEYINVCNDKGYVCIDMLADYLSSERKDWVEDTIQTLKEELQYLIDNLYADVTYKIEDAIKEYEYIKEFKDNQVENFREFVKNELADEDFVI